MNIKKHARLLTVLTAFGLGLGSIASCGTGASSSPITLTCDSKEINLSETFEAKLGKYYTFEANIDTEKNPQFKDAEIVFSNDAESAFEFSADGNYLEFAAIKTGSFTISASVKGDETTKVNVKLKVSDAAKKEYKATVDTTAAKLIFKQGDAFTSEGIVVYKTLVVDGEPSAVRSVLDASEYTVSIPEGKILESKQSALEVKITPNDASLEPVTYTIKVTSNPAYRINSFFSGLAENNYGVYAVNQNSSGQLYVYPTFGINENYIVNYDGSMAYSVVQDKEGEAATLHRYEINFTANDYSFSRISDYEVAELDGNALSIRKSNSLSDIVNNLQFSLGEIWQNVENSSVTYSTANQTYTLNDVDAITNLIKISGYGFTLNNFTVNAGAQIQFSESDDGEVALIVATLTQQGSTQPANLPIVIRDVGTFKDATFDKYLETAHEVGESSDTFFKTALNTIRGNNFKGIFSDMRNSKHQYAGTYATYSVDGNSVELFQHFVENGSASDNGFLGLMKIPEGYEETGYKAYTFTGTGENLEIKQDDEKLGGTNQTTIKNLYDSVLASNWAGFADETSIQKVDFSSMWDVVSVSEGQDENYTRYRLNNGIIAKEWGLCAMNVNEYKEYSPNSLGLWVVDTNKDDKPDEIWIDLEISGGEIQYSAVFDRMVIDLSTAGTTVNEAAQEVIKGFTKAA